jgi:hypothetical protein
MALAGTAMLVGQRWISPANVPPPPSTTISAAPDVPPGFVEFSQHQTGVAVDYPADWTRLDPGDPQVALLAAHGPVSFLVRVLPLGAPVDPARLPPVQKFTNEIVASSASVKLLSQPRQIELGGLAGYFFFYSFIDPSTGQTAVHTHFFLFHGRSLITLVFQAVPAEQFPPAAAIFDRITASFRTD